MPADSLPPEGVAIIGLAGRFPGAHDVRELWQNLCAGTESITRFTDDELRASGIDPALIADPAYVRARGALADADKFDAAFFGITPRDAELTDPQHRVFLECAWHALEDAALDPARFRGSIGVFAGSSLNTYFLDNLASHPGTLADFVPLYQIDGYQLLTGNDKDYLATKLSYRLDLRGPSITVQTACSTSLVAVVQAVNALLTFQCDAALAGGVSITFPQARGHLYSEGALASAEGRCRSFDAAATGTVFGHGCGVVALKRLADALSDRDPIYAVIKGAALNNDGAGKVSFTAPSVDGQAEVIALAHALAGVTADTIGYVEAHGTATPLGDPIEVAALTKAFRATSAANGTCLLGTAKTNLGHLEAAAGVTGLIKTALALKHAQIPASLHFETPNPGIDFANSPFEVVTKLTDWKPAAHPRRAGVSSFGVGGTNAHVVLEEAPAAPVVERTSVVGQASSLPECEHSAPTPSGRQGRPPHNDRLEALSHDPQLLVLSAKTRFALETMTDQLAKFLRDRPTLALADVALTLQTGRRAFEHRLFLIASDTAEAAKLLRRRDRARVFTSSPDGPTNLDEADTLTALGHRWLAGEELDWTTLHIGSTARRISLPGYAFARDRHWIEPHRTARGATTPAAAKPIVEITEPVSMLHELTAFLVEQSGLDLRRARRETSLLELGFDSLFLTQIAIGLQRKFGLRITLRQLLGDLGALGALADFLEAKRTTSAALAPAAETAAKLDPQPAPTGQHGPFRPLQKDLSRALTPAQQTWLDAFIVRYNARTAGSKRHTQKHRAHFADPRAVAGFKQVWKEMVYPLVVERSQGAQFWDLDGNEYIDTTQGFGLALFGHQAPFVMRAIEEQMQRGMEIGPSHPLAGEVAELLCAITGYERATFCNTGSEAILGAIRVARTFSGRSKIALFAGSYHGINDEVLVRPLIVNGEWRTAPIAPGILQDAVENVLVLDYGNPQSLDILRQHAGDIACILVEPVQSRRPDLQPREFLHSLRALCTKTGIALVMDEVITGFRCHIGGAQAWFGVKGDLAAYGKVIGGGLPIGAIAGRAEYMDIFDGGAWQFGDDSSPPSGVTFFAGTFVRHPLALAAAKAVLLHLQASGPTLQTELAERATGMVRELAAILTDTPFEVPHFGSIYYLRVHDFPHSGIFYALLRHRGIHIWESRPCFLGTAHTDEDVTKILTAFRESVAEMRAAGFFPRAGAGLPLGEAQRELWMAAQLGPAASAAFNESVTIHFRGAFDEAAMRRAITEVVARHDALRTRFAREDGAQTVAASAPPEVALHDLTNPGRDAPAPCKEQGRPGPADALTEILAAEGVRLFDLERGPLVAFQILRLAPEHHALVFTAHHIACDGWAFDIVMRELGALYSAFRAGQPSPLAPAMQFANYLRWETAQRATPEAADAENFWLAQYPTLPTPLDLPTVAPRPLARTFAGNRVVAMLPAELREALAKLGAQNGATLFATLLAGFTALLHRLGGQDDLVIGIPAAGQNLAGGDDLVGHCANLLPLRLTLDAGQPFTVLLTTAGSAVLDAMEHQAFTFGTLLQKLNVPRDGGRVPLVPVVFNLDPPLSAIRFAGLAHEIALNPRHHYQFDLGFNIVDESGPLRVECDFNADLFDAGTITRWLAHYRTLLAAAVATPTESLARLPLLPATAPQDGFATWRFAPERCVHELFEAHAASAPEAIALSFASERMSYGALNAAANRLAHHLRALGVGSETLVVLCLERSPALIIAILAVLKAGGAYVPLDPDSPGERLALILADSQAPIVLTQTSLREKLGGTTTRILCLDRDLPALAALPSENLALLTTPAAAAYVIYTSGSTGIPKGVVVTHHNVVRLFEATEAWFRFSAADVWTLFHSPAFDFSVWEIWGALTCGGRLVIVPYLLSRDPAHFYALLAEEKVTVLNQTPLAFAQLSRVEDDPAARRPLALRFVIFGGAALDFATLRPWFERHGDTAPQLVNMYGITETTVHVTYRPITRADLDAPAGSRIGQTIPDLDLLVFDAALSPCPLGVTGELYVGGSGVARGYLRRPELTAERFIPHPWKTGERLYKTGDLARRTADGDLEYLGRVDQQVKVRGFRIELGEIEAALVRHPGVAQCAAILRALPGGENGIVAYYVRRAASAPTDRDLRACLQKCLPAYMLPAALIPLEALPLNANGKLDLAALPSPAPSLNGSAVDHVVAPRNATEKTVSHLWADLIGRNSFSVHDDFFAVGGHSLLAIQLLSRFREKFGVDMPVRRLFDTPSIAGQAEFIDGHAASPPPARPLQSLIAIQRGEPGQRPFFLVPGGWGGELEFLIYAELKLHLGTDLPIYGLQARGADGVAAPHRTVREMVVAYVVEMLSVQPRGPYLLGGECIGGVLAHEIARHLEESGERVDLLVLLDTEWPSTTALRQFCAEERAVKRNAFWEIQTVRFRQHLENLQPLPTGAKLRYIWQRTVRKRGPVNGAASALAPLDWRKALGHYPRLLMAHPLGSYVGKVTLLVDEESHRSHPRLGWDAARSGGLEVHVLPGDHLSYIRENAALTGAKLRALIDHANALLST